MKIKTEVNYVIVYNDISYDHLSGKLYFEGKITDSAGKPSKTKQQFSYSVPNRISKEIDISDWLKLTNFLVRPPDLEQIEIESLRLQNLKQDQKYSIGVKIEKYKQDTGLWALVFEDIKKF